MKAKYLRFLSVSANLFFQPSLSCVEPRSKEDNFPPNRNHSVSAEGNVAQYFKEANAASGTEHYELYNMLCPRLENANAGKIPAPPFVRNDSVTKATPRKVFDNLFYVGEYTAWESSASSWAIDTGEGIVLIDALYDDSAEDLVIEDGQIFTIGNTSFYFYITPGHTPGTVSTIFNTYDNGEEHFVAQWGGTGFGFGGAAGQDKIDWFWTYADSAQRFQALIRDRHPDVLIANHPILDNTIVKLSAQGSVPTNPWIIGVDWVANYTEVAKSCALAGAAAFRKG